MINLLRFFPYLCCHWIVKQRLGNEIKDGVSAFIDTIDCMPYNTSSVPFMHANPLTWRGTEYDQGSSI